MYNFYALVDGSIPPPLILFSLLTIYRDLKFNGIKYNFEEGVMLMVKIGVEMVLGDLMPEVIGNC